MELTLKRGNKTITITKKSDENYYLSVVEDTPFFVFGLPFSDIQKLVSRVQRELESA